VVRILREERVLNEAADYREMAARVRYRLLPGVF
jgi:protein-S-isoprenylcysteine O-methyltransferase Ste14